jgi:hypothetical protein
MCAGARELEFDCFPKHLRFPPQPPYCRLSLFTHDYLLIRVDQHRHQTLFLNARTFNQASTAELLAMTSVKIHSKVSRKLPRKFLGNY